MYPRVEPTALKDAGLELARRHAEPRTAHLCLPSSLSRLAHQVKRAPSLVYATSDKLEAPLGAVANAGLLSLYFLFSLSLSKRDATISAAMRGR